MSQVGEDQTPEQHDAAVVLRPSFRTGSFVAFFVTMELLGLTFLVAAIAGKAWHEPSDLITWLILVIYFAGTPIMYLLCARLFVNHDHVGVTNAVGRTVVVSRSKVATITRESYTRTYFRDEEGKPLFYVRPGTWSDDQLSRLASMLSVPYERRWCRPRRSTKVQRRDRLR